MAVFGVTRSVLRRPGVEVTPFSVFLSPPVCLLAQTFAQEHPFPRKRKEEIIVGFGSFKVFLFFVFWKSGKLMIGLLLVRS